MRLLVAAALVASIPARAQADETEQALSAGVGWATFSTVGKPVGRMEPPTLAPDVGGALAITYERALGSDVSLRGEAAGGLFYGGVQDPKKQSATSFAVLADVGITFRFDVLKYVPYAFGGVGGVLTDGGPIARDIGAVIVVGGGLDILASRARSYGIEGRLASFGGDVTVFTFGVRGTMRWGFF